MSTTSRVNGTRARISSSTRLRLLAQRAPGFRCRSGPSPPVTLANHARPHGRPCDDASPGPGGLPGQPPGDGHARRRAPRRAAPGGHPRGGGHPGREQRPARVPRPVPDEHGDDHRGRVHGRPSSNRYPPRSPWGRSWSTRARSPRTPSATRSRSSSARRCSAASTGARGASPSPRATAPTPVQGLDVSVSLLDVHREADLRQTAWRAIREVFPTGTRPASPGPRAAGRPTRAREPRRPAVRAHRGGSDHRRHGARAPLHRLLPLPAAVRAAPPGCGLRRPHRVTHRAHRGARGARHRAGPRGDPPRRRGLLRRRQRRRRRRAGPTGLRGLPVDPDRQLPPAGRGGARRAAQGRAGPRRKGAAPPGRRRRWSRRCRSPPRSATSCPASTGSGRCRPSSRSRPSTSWTRSAASRASSIRG